MLMTNATVLLVENYEPLRTLYTQALEDEGYTVLPASDGEEALDWARVVEPDVVVLEPSPEDKEAWSHLMQVARRAPIIWNTGRPDFRDRAQAMGVTFLLKSSDVDALCQQVAATLRRATNAHRAA
ncbi:MAG: response regulator [Abditibacteriales bacterium]|nr:response regulator [Abditibacteriales bacterium]MDW8368181.1 response regulator [Abditibacteriales bacterium]